MTEKQGRQPKVRVTASQNGHTHDYFTRTPRRMSKALEENGWTVESVTHHGKPVSY